MIKLIKDTVLTSDFIFILILLGFILVVTLLLLENRRDNIRLKQINQKVKDLIAGDYSQVLDMQEALKSLILPIILMIYQK